MKSATSPRVLVCVPCYSGVDPNPFIRFLIVSQESGRAEAAGKYSVRWMIGGPKVKTQNVRNIACKMALDCAASHLLFVDDDMFLDDKDIVEKLLAHDKAIVAPLFFRSAGNYDPLVFDLDSNGDPTPILDYPKNALVEARGGVGTGVMLIKRQVLEAVKDPWFFYPPNPARSMDLHFCLRAIDLGFQVWCDTSLIVRQLGLPQPVGEDDFLNYQATIHANAGSLTAV